MKILCIGKNYANHIAEMQSEFDKFSGEPVVFLKPDTALLKNNAPFYYPEFSKEIHHEVEVVIKISREGKHIEEKFAPKYYEEIGLGIDFTARDLQTKLKQNSYSWELSKAFDGSAVVSDFIPKSEFADLQNLNFSLEVNGTKRQEGNTSLMIFKIDYIISFLSKFFTLKKGDLIYTGTPAGVRAVQIGDRLCGYLENRKMFDFEVK
ncbi:fumarylacetoacetate hydrolase family protein [Raineya orbicola]|jgi:2-keto-4-pentenoate hydratase/2-oxohepta-3-ene-1,7-dioic acid hydratase in catechol pathway|uniref:2-keto-4-pentenoate hydratase/2-oxohepta-3-ene-17-dioic acid hydratase (Catechol pathway) n=1 Tax=Raineya orbicola TaxID=2016530 RepID=A0A2N3IJF9_9BACT|nr:fumarylacetoacetate hydrolase family protein [Raineya orbicola]PKQ70454.1 2-keto-4-pentenoate hydratase/2-oxohepta-3-ene-17-dioic acid hydratase (catechol pathway) [Raineya orbicola]